MPTANPTTGHRNQFPSQLLCYSEITCSFSTPFAQMVLKPVDLNHRRSCGLPPVHASAYLCRISTFIITFHDIQPAQLFPWWPLPHTFPLLGLSGMGWNKAGNHFPVPRKFLGFLIFFLLPNQDTVKIFTNRSSKTKLDQVN